MFNNLKQLVRTVTEDTAEMRIRNLAAKMVLFPDKYGVRGLAAAAVYQEAVKILIKEKDALVLKHVSERERTKSHLKDKQELAQVKRTLDATITQISKRNKMMISALVNSADPKKVRAFGKGYDQAFKDYVWEHLIGEEEDKAVQRHLFINLYNTINSWTKGLFYETFEVFKVEQAGKPAPSHSWNKLDMLSSNEYWRTVCTIALDSYKK